MFLRNINHYWEINPKWLNLIKGGERRDIAGTLPNKKQKQVSELTRDYEKELESIDSEMTEEREKILHDAKNQWLSSRFRIVFFNFFFFSKEEIILGEFIELIEYINIKIHPKEDDITGIISEFIYPPKYLNSLHELINDYYTQFNAFDEEMHKNIL